MKENREETIADVLFFIAEKDSIHEIRHLIVRLGNRLKPMNEPIALLNSKEVQK